MKKHTDTKKLLFENMGKINSNFILKEDMESEVGDRTYEQKALKLKYLVDELLKNQDYDILDTWYRLMINRRAKKGMVAMSEGQSPDYQQKAEQIKGKIDFLIDTNHYDILDKINTIIDKLFPESDYDIELTEEEQLQSEKFRAEVTGKGENVWSTNGIEFDTSESAKKWLDGLSDRWFGYDMGRVVPISTPTREPVNMESNIFYQNFRR
jgi:hypothetical protein